MGRNSTLITPNVPDTTYRDNCSIVCTFQARGINVDSNIIKIEIAWDGQWNDDTSKMKNHMVVKEIKI